MKFLEEVVKMDLFFDDGVPMDVLAYFTDLEHLQANLDLKDKFFDLQISRKSIKVGLKPETDSF